METLILLTIICFALIAVLRLDWALFIVLAALPTYLLRFNIGPIPATLLELMILIVFAAWFIKDKPWKRLGRRSWPIRRQKYPYHMEIVGILMAAWAGLAIAGFDNSALGIFKAYFLEPIMLYIVIINRGQGGIKKYIWPLSLSAAAVSLFALFQQITGLYIFNDFWALLSQRRVTSFFPYPNAVGLFLAPIFFMLGGLFFSLPRRTNLLKAGQKIFLLLTIASSILAIYFAHSEGALVGIAGGIFAVALLAHKNTRKAAIASAILVVIILSISAPAWNYVEKKATLMDLSGQIRRQQWKETFQMLEDGRLVSGAGLDKYQEAIAPFHQEGIFVKNDDPDWYRKVVWNDEYKKQVWQPVEIYKYPHNIFLNFWTEITLLGALLFTWLIARFFYDAIRLLKTLEREKRMLVLGLIGAMSALVIHGLVDVPYLKNDLAVLFWLIIVMMGIIKIKHTESL